MWDAAFRRSHSSVGEDAPRFGDIWVIEMDGDSCNDRRPICRFFKLLVDRIVGKKIESTTRTTPGALLRLALGRFAL